MPPLAVLWIRDQTVCMLTHRHINSGRTHRPSGFHTGLDVKRSGLCCYFSVLSPHVLSLFFVCLEEKSSMGSVNSDGISGTSGILELWCRTSDRR